MNQSIIGRKSLSLVSVFRDYKISITFSIGDPTTFFDDAIYTRLN